MRHTWISYTASLALAFLVAPASAETIRMAVGQQGIWETSMTEMGVNAGFFNVNNGEPVGLLKVAGELVSDTPMSAALLRSIPTFSCGARSWSTSQRST